MTKELKQFNTKITKNVILTILLIAPLFVSGIAVNQYVYATCVDFDSDGFCEIGFGGNDCDDTDVDVNPGATEVDNGVDDNCDGNIDEGFDGDSDGFTPIFGEDCDDTDETIFPGADEDPGDGVDSNCDGFDNQTMFESDEGDFWKVVEGTCTDGLLISSGAPQSCDLWIEYHGSDTATFIDSIPAHLVVDTAINTNTDDDGTDDVSCTIEVSNQHGKSQSNTSRKTSATLVTCEVDTGDEIHIETHTRGSPSNGKGDSVPKWSPTGCGDFEVNGGFIFFNEVDTVTGEPIPIDEMGPIFVHTTPLDLDCDGVDNQTDQCPDTPPGTEVDGIGCPLV